MPAPRVVLDANIFVSALLGKGSPFHLYEAFKIGAIEVVCSKQLLSELAEVLLRPKFDIRSDEIKVLFRLLRHKATIVRALHRVAVCRDPKDNFILECALSGNASWIVTGDKDLLVLNPFRGIRIVPPTDFLKHLAGH